MPCETCGHNGDMHSDGDETHSGDCKVMFPEGDFCKCQIYIEKDSQNINNENQNV